VADDGESLGLLVSPLIGESVVLLCVGESVGLLLGDSEELGLTLGRSEGAALGLSVADDGESLGLLVSPLV